LIISNEQDRVRTNDCWNNNYDHSTILVVPIPLLKDENGSLRLSVVSNNGDESYYSEKPHFRTMNMILKTTWRLADFVDDGNCLRYILIRRRFPSASDNDVILDGIETVLRCSRQR
jgi:hypothetical protein